MAEGFVKAKEFEDRVIEIKRVSKKTKGGNNIGFTALVVIGDKNGRVGTGLGKARDVAMAVQKGVSRAKDNVVSIKINDGSIAHQVEAKYGGARVLLKPAPEGSGIISGGTVRQVIELVGIRNISTKMLGSKNKTSNVRCVIKALQKLKG